MGRSRILVGGSINTDLVVRTKRAPGAGETVTGTGFAIFGGGKGANQAVATARTSSDVAMLGGVGLDEFGSGRLRDLDAEGVNIQTVARIDGVPSGVALITVEEGGQNRIAYVPGATWSVGPEQAIQALDFWRPTCVLTTLELPRATVLELYSACKERRITVICNATPEPSEGLELVALADIVIVNEQESIEILGLASKPADWSDASSGIRALGPDAAIITLGSDGALVDSRDGVAVVPAKPVEVVDTTGAGDAFCGAFASFLTSGVGIVEAARKGAIAGTLAVTRAGAQPSMPTLAEIEAADRD